MKTILGATIQRKSFHKYENVLPGKREIHTNGMIWTDGKFNIIIRKGKFFLQDKEGKSHGIIGKKTKAYQQIKRAIAIWFKSYRFQNVSFTDRYCRHEN